jgi:hypothetical protein
MYKFITENLIFESEAPPHPPTNHKNPTSDGNKKQRQHPLQRKVQNRYGNEYTLVLIENNNIIFFLITFVDEKQI